MSEILVQGVWGLGILCGGLAGLALAVGIGALCVEIAKLVREEW